MPNPAPSPAIVLRGSSHHVTLDPGGFVVRDAAGRALEVFYAKHKAHARMLELDADHGEQSALFTPAPASIPGQLTL